MNEGQPSSVEVTFSRVAGALGKVSTEIEATVHGSIIEATLPSLHLVEAARVLRDQLDYALLSMVTAVDYGDRIELIYLAYALGQPHGVMLKTSLPPEDEPACPTLTSIWPGAEFQEREVYDLMGIRFIGHPDLTRILTEDDFPGHPLRKDFSIEPDYVLMRHLRHGVDGQLAPDEDHGLPTANGRQG